MLKQKGSGLFSMVLGVVTAALLPPVAGTFKRDKKSEPYPNEGISDVPPEEIPGHPGHPYTRYPIISGR